MLGRAAPATEIHTDEFACYRCPDQLDRTQKTVSHSNGEFARCDNGKADSTNAAESMFGSLRASVICVCRPVSNKQPHHYLAVVAGKRNSRDLDTVVLMGQHVANMIGTRLPYATRSTKTAGEMAAIESGRAEAAGQAKIREAVRKESELFMRPCPETGGMRPLPLVNTTNLARV